MHLNEKAELEADLAIMNYIFFTNMTYVKIPCGSLQRPGSLDMKLMIQQEGIAIMEVHNKVRRMILPCSFWTSYEKNCYVGSGRGLGWEHHSPREVTSCLVKCWLVYEECTISLKVPVNCLSVFCKWVRMKSSNNMIGFAKTKHPSTVLENEHWEFMGGGGGIYNIPFSESY